MIERYKEEICIQESSHVIIVGHLNYKIKLMECEINKAKATIDKSLEELKEKLNMIQADREVHLNELTHLRLRQAHEEEMRQKIESETRTMIENEKEQERKERMASKIQNVFRLFMKMKIQLMDLKSKKKAANKDKRKKAAKN